MGHAPDEDQGTERRPYCKNSVVLFLYHEGSDHKRVHPRTEKCPNRVSWCAHDRLATQIERGVHHHRHSSALAKPADQLPVERIDVTLDSLWPRAAIHMRYRRNHAALF